METIKTPVASYHYYINQALELVVCEQTKVHELKKIGSRAVSSADALNKHQLKMFATEIIADRIVAVKV